MLGLGDVGGDVKALAVPSGVDLGAEIIRSGPTDAGIWWKYLSSLVHQDKGMSLPFRKVSVYIHWPRDPLAFLKSSGWKRGHNLIESLAAIHHYLCVYSLASYFARQWELY